MKKYALALDLKNDPELIEKYESHHKDVWPEILTSLQNSGIHKMEIYRVYTRLFMVMETSDDFSFEKKSKMDAADPKVQEWETLMWKYQQALPLAEPGEKWILMDRIFKWEI